MATVAMSKMSSKLSTRNNFTGRAMDRMTKEKLQQLFDGEYNYESWENKYIQRRFHAEEYLQQIRSERRRIFEKEQKKHNADLLNLTEMIEQEEKNDTEVINRFNTFLTRYDNGMEKPVLALDVDNTLIYVRFFSEEMQIGDHVTYFHSEHVQKNNGQILKIRLTLTLEIRSNELMDIFGKDKIVHLYYTHSNAELKQYRKGATFEYPLNQNNEIKFIECKIRNVEISGCLITVYDAEAMRRQEIEIDFTEPNEKLNRFEPCMERDGFLPVDFIYEGFLVRLRPNLDEFMEYVVDDFHVVIYTSANSIIYHGLLAMLHNVLCDALGRESEREPLWNDVLYRDDCQLSYDARGKPYHQKDLTLFGCDLSRLIMVDNSPIVCQGEEPNLILVKDFFGRNGVDDELMEVYQLLDAVTSIEGDVRYFLCGLVEHDIDTQPLIQSVDLSTQQSCMHATLQLIAAMKAYYNEVVNIYDVDEDEKADAEMQTTQHLMDDYDEEEVTQERKQNIFRQITTRRQATELLDDLAMHHINLAINDSIDSDDDDEEEEADEEENERNEEETKTDEEDAIYVTPPTNKKRKRKSSDYESTSSSSFIPAKHSKNDSTSSYISVRDLNVIKKEKMAKRSRMVSFMSDTNFENAATNVSTPTEKKRKKSAVLNSMAPRPQPRALLKTSKPEDFYTLFLQQLVVNKEDERDDAEQEVRDAVHGERKSEKQQEQEINRMRLQLKQLEEQNQAKTSEIEQYREKEREYKRCMECIQNEMRLIELKGENERLVQALKEVKSRNDEIHTEKQKLQQKLNQVVESKLCLIETACHEMQHYRQLLAQFAEHKVTISLT